MQAINENVVMVVRFMSTLSVLSVPLGLLAKALLTVSSYKTALGTQADKVPFLQGFTSCVLLASAGTNTVAILRGESIGVLKNTPFWMTFGVVYTLIFYSKTISDAIQKAMTSPLFKAVFLALVCMDRGDTMIRYGVDGVTSIIGTDKLIAKLVCGTLAGCAGDLWSEMFGLRLSQWSFRTPSVFFAFGAEMRISLFTVITYLGLMLLAFESRIAHAWSVLFFTIANLTICITFSKKTKKE